MSLFAALTAPAGLFGRFRSDIRRSNTVDATRFGGSFSPVFAVLALIAIGYPIIASVVHAFGPPTRGLDYLPLALRPFYDIVYAESLPFMIVAVGLGLASPALGVLFMTVFIPADLWAAAASSAELRTPPWFSSFPAAIAARLASLGLLWILAVEIPLLTHRWGLAWAARGDRPPTLRDVALGRIAGTALLVYLWASALPWLIQPAFTWTFVQNVPRWAAAPTWSYWWILVIAATVLAGIASARSRPPNPELMLDFAIEDAQMPSRSMLHILLRQSLAVLVLALLLGGLMTTKAEAIVLIVGLIVAGPVLTPLLPRIPMPAALTRARRSVRWIAGMGVALAVSGMILVLAREALFAKDYFVLTAAFAVAASILRVVVDAGRLRGAASGAPLRGTSPATALAFTALLVASAVSVVGPVAAFADDCSDATVGEARSCANHGIGAAYPMLGAALAALATALAMAKGRPDESVDDHVRWDSGYRHYKRYPLGQRLSDAFRNAMRSNKYDVKTTRATSGVRG